MRFVVLNDGEGSSPSEVGSTLGICGVDQCRPHLGPRPLADTHHGDMIRSVLDLAHN